MPVFDITQVSAHHYGEKEEDRLLFDMTQVTTGIWYHTGKCWYHRWMLLFAVTPISYDQPTHMHEENTALYLLHNWPQ